MRLDKRIVVAVQLLLIIPAALFIVALLVRDLQPLLDQAAYIARLVVIWYSERVWTLWLFLAALPFTVFVLGSGALMQDWTARLDPRHVNPRTSVVIDFQPTAIAIWALTMLSAVILTVVAVHVLIS